MGIREQYWSHARKLVPPLLHMGGRIFRIHMNSKLVVDIKRLALYDNQKRDEDMGSYEIEFLEPVHVIYG